MISLFAGDERTRQQQKLGDPLEVLERHVDFASLARAVDAKLKFGSGGKKGGRPPYATELMVRLLVLQQLYNLSDEALEFQVLDRSSFQRFLGLSHSGRVPDAKTVWVWRERLKTHDLIGDISQAVGGQLTEAGFIARGGQIIDATFVTAPIQRNRRSESQQVRDGETPSDWSDAKRAQKDVDARWTRKDGKTVYGYKLHANTDRRFGFIRQAEVTAASVHDSKMFEAVLDPGNACRDVYADKGYAKREREAALIAQGYRPCLHRKGEARRPLSAVQERRNRRLSKQRAFGEHPFARLSQMGGKHLRTIGLARARVVIGLKVIAHNLMHLARLQHRMAAAA